MTETSYSFFVIVLIDVGVAGLVWANLQFGRMSRALGALGRWGMVIPTTRFGMNAAMTSIVFLGLAAVPPVLQFYPDPLRGLLLALFIVVAAVGLIHDLSQWLAHSASHVDRSAKRRRVR